MLKQRLHYAIAAPDHRLMLECYPPSEKLYTPYLYCNYLYTDSFAGVEAEAEGTPAVATGHHDPHPAGGLRGIYSHFRPVEHDENPARRARYSQRRHSSVSSTASSTTTTTTNHPPSLAVDRPAVDVYLDDDESFSQLCTTTNLVRLGPKPGLFRSHVNVGDGVVRVRRDWLAAQVSGAVQGDDDGGDGILWADATRDVGVRFRVTEKEEAGRERPVLVGSEELVAVAYRLEFEELVVRSSTLLVMVERSEVREVAAEGKAIVLASF